MVKKKPTKKKLTRLQMRVAVAKDVLLQLKTEAYVATKGFYLTFANLTLNRRACASLTGKENRALLKKLEPGPCRVCGIGAVFLSKVRKFDGVSGGLDLYGRGGMIDACEELFKNTEMGLIEEAFEGYYDWHDQLRISSTTRLTAIMKSIVAKRGRLDAKDIRARMEAAYTPVEVRGPHKGARK